MKRSQRLCRDTQDQLNKTKEKKGKVLPFLICCLCIFLVLGSGVLNGATYTVINTNDTGAGSLRWAITSANTVTPNVHDTIDFNIAPPGLHTIFPLSQLPPLTDTSGVLIDGLTQPPGGSVGGNPPATLNLLIEIDGISAGMSYGIWIKSDNNTIQGLIINNFEADGISIEAGPIQNTNHNQIFWNIIGMDPSGMGPKGNGRVTTSLWAGVRIHNIPAEISSIAFDNHIVENLISANYAEGVAVIGPQLPGDVYGNHIIGNYIGTDITGMVDQGNIHEGVCLCEGTYDNLVDDNLISGNDYDGVGIQGFNNEPYPAPPIQTQFNLISNNIIGLDINLAPLPNTYHGVAVGEYGPTQWGCADLNWIGPNNIIAYNGGDGVAVWEDYINSFNADGNQISQNSIYDNNGLGIDLQNNGVTFNDPSDPDSGPNQELNFPVITGAWVNGLTLIIGTIDIDTDPAQAMVEVFRASPDPSGYGEGALYLGYTTPDAAGNWNVTVTGLVIGDTVTATTTDMNMNTSEFSQNNIVILGIEEGGSSGKPSGYILNQNIPNPFSYLTTIGYALPKTGHVSLKIYDVSGKLVKTLADEIYSPSYYTAYWNGRDESGCKVCSGVYFYILETEDFSATKKLILTK